MHDYTTYSPVPTAYENSRSACELQLIADQALTKIRVQGQAGSKVQVRQSGAFVLKKRLQRALTILGKALTILVGALTKRASAWTGKCGRAQCDN